MIENNELIMVQGKIYVPIKLRQRVVNWYHFHLCNPGATRLSNTISQTMFWPGMVNHVKQLTKHCDICQRYKKPILKYGELPAKI